MQHMHYKKGLKVVQDKEEATMQVELRQLYERQVHCPKRPKDLTEEQQKKALD